MRMTFLLRLTSLCLAIGGAIGCCKEENIPSAIDSLYSKNAKDRNDAALELARCGERSAKAVPRLTQLMYDENVGVQSASAYALRKIDTKEARLALQQAEERRRKNR